jgi:peptidoglycan/LPS O-acetylase OafA/YrhL
MVIHSIEWLDLPAHPYLLWAIGPFQGVAIFFVVSGFLVSGSLMAPGKTLGAYFAARALRIYPALWVNLAALLGLIYLGGNLALDPASDTFWNWASVAFSSGSDWVANGAVAPVFQTGGFYEAFPSGVLWTIPVELSFYLILPFILSPIVPRWLSIAIWGSASVWVFFEYTYDEAPIFIGRYLWVFLFGVALRVYWPHVRPFIEGKAWFWLPAFIIGCYVTAKTGPAYYFNSASWVNIAMTALLSLAVISCAFTLKSAASVLKGNDISYGLYLWHMPVIWTLREMGLGGHWVAGAVAYIAAAVIAALSWHLIEKPALGLKARGRTLPSQP